MPSNTELSILAELKTLQLISLKHPSKILFYEATMNSAKALGEEKQFGKIETGKKPGLLLLQNVDLQNMKLLPDSFVSRLI